MLIAATVFGSTDEFDNQRNAAGAIAGMWDLRLPHTQRFFFTATGSIGYYPRKRAYSAAAFRPGETRPGSNESTADQYIEVGGNDNWMDFRLEYMMPMGAAKEQGMLSYTLKNGMLSSEPTGGKKWGPLESGATIVMLRQYNRYQNYQLSPAELERTVHPVELAVSYDNTDFPDNPSYGSRQFIGATYDFGWLESEETWSFFELEASKFFSLGKSDWARQRVIVLNFWTGDAPTTSETVLPNRLIQVNNSPPYYEGATLGGFYRMRAYPFYRFNDRSGFYTSGEYRYTPEWNPIGEVHWLRFLKMDWWQFVGFAEGGRVAREYSFSELTKNWKYSIGGSTRFMVAGGVFRVDLAFSDEGGSFWVMAGHPF